MGIVMKGGSMELEMAVEFEPTSISYSSKHQHLAVGEGGVIWSGYILHLVGAWILSLS